LHVLCFGKIQLPEKEASGQKACSGPARRYEGSRLLRRANRNTGGQATGAGTENAPPVGYPSRI